MTAAEFEKHFMALLDQDSKKTFSNSPGSRTLLDTEAKNLARHLYEWFQAEGRPEMYADHLAVLLLKTQKCTNVQDRAVAIVRLLFIP